MDELNELNIIIAEHNAHLRSLRNNINPNQKLIQSLVKLLYELQKQKTILLQSIKGNLFKLYSTILI